MNYILNVIEKLAETTADAQNNQGSVWVYVALIALVVLMLVLPMITQRKRNKEYSTMLESLAVGDTVKTIGGVIGRVTKIQERTGGTKTIILETGLKNNKTTMEFDIAAVGMILNEKKPATPVVEEKVENKVEEPKIEEQKAEEEKAEAPVVEEKVEEKIEEKKPAVKKAASTKKATTTKKTTTAKKTTTTKKSSK